MIAQVCRQLDGIPLAIELAAARTRLLSIEQIAERLDHAFLLLTGGSRTALPRQQTLRATIDWSYHLLPPEERALLLSLSVFSGGWSLAAAEAICAGDCANQGNLPAEVILDRLGRLADKSLILVEPGIQGEPRYRMLDTIRQYARERLFESGGEPALRSRHLDYYLRYAEEAETHSRAWGMLEWGDRMEMELGNLRLALEWSLTGAIEEGLRLAAALTTLWHGRSLCFEGVQWLERLLDADAADKTIEHRSKERLLARGKALLAAAAMNDDYPVFGHERGQLQYNEAGMIFNDLGDPAEKYQMELRIANSSTLEEFEDCLTWSRKVGDEYLTAECIRSLGQISCTKGEIEKGAAYQEENLAIRKKIGDTDGEGFACYLLALVVYMQGDPGHALEL